MSESFLNKVTGLTLLKKRFWHRCFSVNFFTEHVWATASEWIKIDIELINRRDWRRSGVFIVNFEYISHLAAVVFLLSTLNR